MGGSDSGNINQLAVSESRHWSKVHKGSEAKGDLEMNRQELGKSDQTDIGTVSRIALNTEFTSIVWVLSYYTLSVYNINIF